MNFKNSGTALGVVGGCLLGIGISFGFGAGNKQAAISISPRYSVQYAGAAMMVTDNVTNRLYIYENTHTGSKLRQYLDLSKTGEDELKAIKPGAMDQ